MEKNIQQAVISIHMPNGSVESIEALQYGEPGSTGTFLLQNYQNTHKIREIKEYVNSSWLTSQIPMRSQEHLPSTRILETTTLQTMRESHTSRQEWELEYAYWHRYYFIPDTPLSTGSGKWFYSSPGMILDEKSGEMVLHKEIPLSWEIYCIYLLTQPYYEELHPDYAYLSLLLYPESLDISFYEEYQAYEEHQAYLAYAEYQAYEYLSYAEYQAYEEHQAYYLAAYDDDDDYDDYLDDE